MTKDLPIKEQTQFMRLAIDLALAQKGRTMPNPSVGCVIVKDGMIVGQGATADGGRPHAEELALIDAGDAAVGATAYVTLEPCGARSMGGLSCSERLVLSGVVCVYYACRDASPFASHIGIERLRGAGVTVFEGLMAEDAQNLISIGH